MMRNKVTVENLRKEVGNIQKKYVKRITRELQDRIKSAALSGSRQFWYTFFWSEGDYSDVLESFEAIGIKFGSPTGPDEGGETSFLVDISVVLE